MRTVISPKNLNCEATIKFSDLRKQRHTLGEYLIEEYDQMAKDVIWFVKNDYLKTKGEE